jgi:hypothetical protein
LAIGGDRNIQLSIAVLQTASRSGRTRMTG